MNRIYSKVVSNVVSWDLHTHLPAASKLPKLFREKSSVGALVHCSLRSPISQPWTCPWFHFALCRSCCLPLFVRGLSVVRTVQRTKVSALWFSKLPYRRAIVNFTTVTKNRPNACLIWLKFLPNQRTVLWVRIPKALILLVNVPLP